MPMEANSFLEESVTNQESSLTLEFNDDGNTKNEEENKDGDDDKFFKSVIMDAPDTNIYLQCNRSNIWDDCKKDDNFDEFQSFYD
jgi:hypothetical protein